MNVYPIAARGRLTIWRGVAWGMVLVSSLARAAGDPAPLSLAHFPRSLPLATDGKAALYRFTVPLDVYQHAAYADLHDVRVFNGAGEVVPYSITDSPAVAEQQSSYRPVPIFPLPPTPASDTAPVPFTVRIDQTAHGTLVAVHTSNEAAAAANPHPQVYLVDVSQVTDPISALRFDWADADYSGAVHIAASADLQQWQPLADGQLMRLNYAGQALQQNQVEFASLPVKYLRLSWDGAAPQLREVAVRVTHDGVANPRLWLAPTIATPSQVAGEYRFDLGAQAPVDHLRFALPQPNTLAQVTVSSRASPTMPWHEVYHGNLFRLMRSNGEIRNPDVVIEPDRDRYWQLQVNMAGGGLGAGQPTLAAGWLAQTVTFVARGSAPFTLAYGRTRVDDASQALAAQGLDASVAVGEATPGQATAHAVAPEAPPTDADRTRKWVLWGVLLVAVGLLGGMAYKLARQMQAEDGNAPK